MSHALNPQTWTKHKNICPTKVLARVCKVHSNVLKHPTRLPLANKQITNMALSLRLQGGAAGEWNVRAELLLAELVGKPIGMRSGAPETVEDKKPLVIKDKPPSSGFLFV